MVVSLVILTGWAGQISLGQWAFSGLGAPVAGYMAGRHHSDFFATLVVAGLVGAAAAVVVGLPALRIQGLYLAITTLGFAIMVQVFFLNKKYFGASAASFQPRDRSSNAPTSTGATASAGTGPSTTPPWSPSACACCLCAPCAAAAPAAS